jgi:outer membrane protein assembly factor BamE
MDGMIIRLLFCSVFAVLVCTGCGLIYRQNIQQGNAIEQEDLDELYEGMNKRQVLFVLGTPSVMDPFHHDRWDYVQTFSRRGGDIVKRTVTIKFENDLLVEIIGRDDPLGATADEAPGDADEVATFTKKAAAKPQTDPHAAAIESAEEEALSPNLDIEAIEERTSEDRELCRRWLQSGYELVKESEAVLKHAPKLNFSRFWSKYSSYGEGAAKFHQDPGEDWALTIAYHFRIPSLLRAEFGDNPQAGRLGIISLIMVWELANLAGYFKGRFKRSRGGDRQ